jgi:hypothetical protein
VNARLGPSTVGERNPGGPAVLNRSEAIFRNQETRMIRQRLLLAAALALGLSACGKSTAPDFAAGTPDAAGLTLETTGGAGDGLVADVPAAGAALTVASSGPGALAATLPTCQDYEFTCNIRRSVKGVNLFVRAALEPVEALVAAGPSASPSDDVRVYGPVALPPAPATPVANFRLTVKFIGDETFRWKLEAQPTSPADAPFQLVMAGQLHRGDLPHRGRGVVGIDLDALHAVNATAFTGQGKLLAAFAHVGLQKALVFAAHGFSADGVQTPVSAVFAGWKNAVGQARVRLAALSDFDKTTAQDELLLGRAGYWPLLGAGRTAVAVVGGDVGSHSVAGSFDVKAFLGLECFGPGIEANVTYRALWTCGTNTSVNPAVDECRPVDQWNATNGVGVGAGGFPVVGACAPSTDLYDPSAGVGTDPDSTTQEPGAPVTPDAPPSAMPAF